MFFKLKNIFAMNCDSSLGALSWKYENHPSKFSKITDADFFSTKDAFELKHLLKDPLPLPQVKALLAKSNLFNLWGDKEKEKDLEISDDLSNALGNAYFYVRKCTPDPENNYDAENDQKIFRPWNSTVSK